ncbi:DUF6221 family protein [Streptomyces sp. NPDC004376]
MGPLMDDLVQWLTTQLDEDERIARESGGAAWEELPVTGWVHTSPLPATEWQPPGYDHHVASVPLPADRVHIVAHDPARVLRETDAKRRIVERYAWLREHGDTGDIAWVLPLLALPYADREGYREEWRP